MKKVIIFEEDELKEKFLKFVDTFIKMSEKGYGVKLISNETNEIYKDRESIAGTFMLVWDDTFK